MKLQFLNTIPLEIISGGNIYNHHIIKGLINAGHVVDYNQKPSHVNYDISIVDSLYMNTINTSALDCNKPIVSLIHEIPKLDRATLLFFSTYSKFVVTGAPIKQRLIENWNLKGENISLIRPGLAKYWSKKKQYNRQPRHIAIVANFIKLKGYDILIKLITKLKHYDLEFTIIGNPTMDENYANEIINAITHLKAKVKFHFNVKNNEVYKHVIQSDIFLNLSQSESFGMALFEALSIGIPSISSKTGDYVYFNQFPNYYPLNDYAVTSFTNTILDWINNPIKYATYCKHFNKEFRTWPHVVNEFYKFLENIK
ncbi:MAG: glycosyltransferase family 4 protein [Flavobacteriaceae bacterium]|nr:glycosyltransferase family 4 protein [Flavobacteriaceae bacterium]